MKRIRIRRLKSEELEKGGMRGGGDRKEEKDVRGGLKWRRRKGK